MDYAIRFARPRLILVFVFALIIIGNVIFSARTDAATTVSSSGVVSNINSLRASAGASNLIINSQLSRSAQAKAQDMLNDQYWSHTAPDGSTPWTFIRQAGYEYALAGENLAFGYSTSAGVVNGWNNSPSHRTAMLNAKFVDVGIGIVSGKYEGVQTTFVVAHFAEPLFSHVLAKSTPKSTPAQTTSTTAPRVTSTNTVNPAKTVVTSTKQTKVVLEVKPQINKLSFKAIDLFDGSSSYTIFDGLRDSISAQFKQLFGGIVKNLTVSMLTVYRLKG